MMIDNHATSLVLRQDCQELKLPWSKPQPEQPKIQRIVYRVVTKKQLEDFCLILSGIEHYENNYIVVKILADLYHNMQSILFFSFCEGLAPTHWIGWPPDTLVITNNGTWYRKELLWELTTKVERWKSKSQKENCILGRHPPRPWDLDFAGGLKRRRSECRWNIFVRKNYMNFGQKSNQAWNFMSICCSLYLVTRFWYLVSSKIKCWNFPDKNTSWVMMTDVLGKRECCWCWQSNSCCSQVCPFFSLQNQINQAFSLSKSENVLCLNACSQPWPETWTWPSFGSWRCWGKFFIILKSPLQDC